MGIARGAMKHVAGMDTFTPLDGIGDEAYLAPGNSALMMRKGDVLVQIDLREVWNQRRRRGEHGAKHCRAFVIPGDCIFLNGF